MSKIQWTDETWNPTIGCSKVSSGCKHCYAMSQAARIVAMSRGRGQESPYENVVEMDDDGEPTPRWNRSALFLPERLDQPLRWRKPRRVFVDSMSDLFHEDISFEEIAAVYGVMAAARQHTFQVLTKRPGRAKEFFGWVQSEADQWGDGLPMTVLFSHVPEAVPAHIWEPLMESWVPEMDDRWPLPNVWLGVSAENQEAADERIPPLLECPAAVRFVSAEPLLGPIDFSTHRGASGLPIYFAGDPEDGPLPIVSGFTGQIIGHRERQGWTRHDHTTPMLDWIIVGGESGADARPCAIEWVRSIVEQCDAASVPVFVKQLGAYVTSTNRGCPPGDDLHDGPDSDEWQWWWRAGLEHSKGGDPEEWPADLRVRQFPGEV